MKTHRLKGFYFLGTVSLIACSSDHNSHNRNAGPSQSFNVSEASAPEDKTTAKDAANDVVKDAPEVEEVTDEGFKTEALEILSYVHEVEKNTVFVRTAVKTCAQLQVDQAASGEQTTIATVETAPCEGEPSYFHTLKFDTEATKALVITNPVLNYRLDDAAVCDLENFIQWHRVGSGPVAFNLAREMTFGYEISSVNSELSKSPDRLDAKHILISDCPSEVAILREHFYDFSNETF